MNICPCYVQSCDQPPFSFYLCVASSFLLVSTPGQAAMDMQEKITARREQIDSLQGKIQHLEETVEKQNQVKSLMYQWPS